METPTLKQVLESLCNTSVWSYAVFWELHQSQHQTLLIYEDGYFDYNKLQQSYQSNLNPNSRMGETQPHQFWGADPVAGPVAFAIHDMSDRQYLLGQGVIGRVAHFDSDLWLYWDGIECAELISEIEHTNEWLLPLVAGIKTTLTISISPYGVLQLGSSQKVAENVPEVSEFRDLIVAQKCTMLPTEFTSQTPHFSSSLLMPEWRSDDDISFSVAHRNYSQEVFSSVTDDEILGSCEIIVPFTSGHYPSLEEMTSISLLVSDENVTCPCLDLCIESDRLTEFSVAHIPELYENMCAYYTLDGEHVDTGISTDSSSGVSSDAMSGQVKHSPEADNFTSPDYTVLCNVDYADSSNLHEELGPAFYIRNNERSGYSEERKVDGCSFGWFDEGSEQDHLLEAAIATLYQNSDDTVSYTCNSKSSATSSEAVVPSKKNSSETTTALTEHDMTSIEKCVTLSGHQSTFGRCMASPPSFEGFESSLLEQRQLMNCTPKVRKSRKDKAKPQSNLRPRPRDRQLIQDRLKELRNLVPNGAKCSIDGLLEHTTKHMKFLRSMTEQAEKVRQFTDQQSVMI